MSSEPGGSDDRAGGVPARGELDFDWDGFDFGRIFRKKSTPHEVPSRTERDKYKLLLEISKGLSANLDLDDLLVEILDTVISVTRMQKGFLMLRDQDGRFRMRVARNLERKNLGEDAFHVSRSVIREVARTGRPIYIADIEKGADLPGQESLHDQRALVSFPLTANPTPRADRLWGLESSEDRVAAPATASTARRPRTVGLIYVESPLAVAEFPVVDLEFIEALAAQATVAIENAWLYERLHRDRIVLADENRDLRREVRGKYGFENMVGTCDRMRAVYELLARVSASTVNVMIRGDSGTGKELVAKTIHYNSDRAKKPFVSVNCAALPEALLESELFGIEKGVATGVSQRIGKFELAQGGTFFLDEVGDMSLTIQAKLLRVIEAREVQRVGGKVSIPVDVRLVAATNRDLEAAIRSGDFREDLYFRLNVVPVYLPALRERSEDIPKLVEHFIAKHAAVQKKNIEGMSRAALDSLLEHSWPGNVRELENVIQRAILMCDANVIAVEHLPREVLDRRSNLLETASEDAWTAERLVREYARRMLERNGGNLSRTARDLGMDFKTLKKKVEDRH